MRERSLAAVKSRILKIVCMPPKQNINLISLLVHIHPRSYLGYYWLRAEAK